jgi:alpha-mannosidase
MVCVKAGDNKGTLQNEYSLFTVDCDNVIFETAKKAETEDSIILRGCEYFNKRTTANVKFGFNVKKAYLCDMLENNIQELDVKDNTVTIDFKPFEINTVKIVK